MHIDDEHLNKRPKMNYLFLPTCKISIIKNNKMNNMYTIIFTSSQHFLKYFLYHTIHKIQSVTI
jgi:hypothetical protein